MCCSRGFEAKGYSSVCPGCCTLSQLWLHSKPEKGKWLKKKISSENGPREKMKEEAGWLTKQGARDKGEQAREQRT